MALQKSYRLKERKEFMRQEQQIVNTLCKQENPFGVDTELQANFPNLWQEYIERLSEYMASTGETYKSYAVTIRR